MALPTGFQRSRIQSDQAVAGVTPCPGRPVSSGDPSQVDPAGLDAADGSSIGYLLSMLSTADRLEIHELLALHGFLADGRQFDELDQLLVADAVYDVTDFGLGRVVGLDAIRKLWAGGSGEQPAGHHVTNVLVTEHPDGSVHVRSKGIAVMANGAAGTVVYEDVVTRTEVGWRIAVRRVVGRSS